MLTGRFCVAPHSLNGLGNQFFCWAKSFIAARELEGVVLPPAWSRNPRGYRQLFGTMPMDWEAYRVMMLAWPTFELTDEDYRKSGATDYGDAVRDFARRHGLRERRFFILVTSGMWGGYLAIRRARHFIFQQLYRVRGSASYLYEMGRRLSPAKLCIAVHIRRGDFAAHPSSEAEWRGRRNTALPLDWYVRTCRTLKQEFGDRLQFLLFSDGTVEELEPFLTEFQPVRPPPWRGSEVTDLLLMSQTDLLICSTSTYSLLGAFLSNAPYLWFEPQLEQTGDFYTLANEGLSQQEAPPLSGGEAEDFAPAAYARPLKLLPRGLPVKLDGAIAESHLAWLDGRLAMNSERTDLIFYGSVPRKPARLGVSP